MRVDSLLRNPGRLALLCGVLAMALARGAPAQTSTGSIRGDVTDSSGAPIVGARVVAVDTQTPVQREGTTQDNGIYASLGLVAGVYDGAARQHSRARRRGRDVSLVG